MFIDFIIGSAIILILLLDDTDKKDIAVKKENKKDVIDTEIYDGDEDTTEEEDFDDILG